MKKKTKNMLMFVGLGAAVYFYVNSKKKKDAKAAGAKKIVAEVAPGPTKVANYVAIDY